MFLKNQEGWWKTRGRQLRRNRYTLHAAILYPGMHRQVWYRRKISPAVVPDGKGPADKTCQLLSMYASYSDKPSDSPHISNDRSSKKVIDRIRVQFQSLPV